MRNGINRNSAKKILKSKLFKFVFLPAMLLLIAFIIIVPKVNFIGKSVEVVAYKSEYKDKGVKANFLGKNVSSDVVISGKVDTSKVGKYEVTYTLNKYLIPIKKTRIVEVKDLTAPVITLTGEKTVTVCPNKEYEEEGFTALDDFDKDVTKKVKVNKEKDKITYTVTDKSGNEGKVTRKIKYEDKEPPVINLNGVTTMYVLKNAVYTDPGYAASDNCDGDLTANVTIDGAVNTAVAGEYMLTYKVSDTAGNTVTAERKVIVTASVNPNSGVSKPGVIYLTFDDGPQEGTTDVILDILKEEGVKATFFVTNKGPDYLIKREADEGHTVALHTASHDYATVYASVDGYFYDLALVHDRVQRITGLDSRIIRFPGGSSNTVSRRYCNGIMSVLTNEVLNRGYRYYDWNISSGDAGSTTDPNQVYLNVAYGLSHDRANMVLMHDIKWYTRDALRNIIRYGKDNGFTFEAINMDTAMVRQRVNN